MTLVSQIYGISGAFPLEERFGLTSQVRRAAISIPSNIAEGFARRSPKENAQFISVALGSVAEVDTQLQLASNLGFGQVSEAQELLIEVRKMLIVMRSKLV